MSEEVENPEPPPAEVEGSMKPMSVKMSSEKADDTTSSWFSDDDDMKIGRQYLLVTDENARKYSLWALYFHTFTNAVNTKMLNPNFAIIASPGAHPDSFDNTNPFDFNSATYFMPLASLLGVAIASVFTGQISDRMGRKKIITFCSVLSGIGSIGMYLARKTFWGFCGASFAAGLFRGTLPVCMAYIGDIFTTKKEKEDHLGVVVAYFVLGNAGGGIFAILMENSGLFTPLLLGAGFIMLSAIIGVRYVIEPGDARLTPIGKEKLTEELYQDEEEQKRPETIDNKTLLNIVIGALADNVGSTALFPLCLSPLALEQYYISFRNKDPPEDPVMSIIAYKWLSVCVAIMVIPGTLITPWVFSKVGSAGGCVLGNVATGILTIALLLIANGPATTAAFAGFITVMYLGFPLTVISQLSTGPMLDIIAPEDKLGYVQGLNNTVMNLGMAVAPWVFGLLADGIGTNPAIWIGIGISFLAGIINAPLMCKKGLGIPEKKTPPERRPLAGEDQSLVERMLQGGEWIPPHDRVELNLRRARAGQYAVLPNVTSYEDDVEHIPELRLHAQEEFLYRRNRIDQILARMADPEEADKIPEACEKLNFSLQGDPSFMEESHEKIGKWFADYLRGNGYNAQSDPLLIKLLVATAFPEITKGQELTPDNLEQGLINARQIYNQYLALPETNKYGLIKILGNRGSAVGYFS